MGRHRRRRAPLQRPRAEAIFLPVRALFNQAVTAHRATGVVAYAIQVIGNPAPYEPYEGDIYTLEAARLDVVHFARALRTRTRSCNPSTWTSSPRPARSRPTRPKGCARSAERAPRPVPAGRAPASPNPRGTAPPALTEEAPDAHPCAPHRHRRPDRPHRPPRDLPLPRRAPPADGRAPVVLVTRRWKFLHTIETHTYVQPYGDEAIHYKWKASGAFIVADAAPGFPDGGVPYAFPCTTASRTSPPRPICPVRNGQMGHL
ncbi:hypothetical protein NKG05_30785 [Oerskovia sp. M15]